MGSQSFSSKPVKREFCHISIVYIILTSVLKRQLAYVCRPCWYTVCYYSVSCAVWSQEKPGCIWSGIQSDASRKSRGLWAPLLMLYAEGTLGGSSFTMAQGEPMVPGMYTLSMHCGMGTHAPDAHCKFVLPVCPAYLPRIPKSSWK